MATNAHKTTSTFIDNNLAAIGVEDESLVLAWAKDVATGAPIYILQLGEDRKGAKRNCICMGCEEPLTAVNAGKVVGTYKKRPHFRHHVGVQTDSCAVLTARALALQQLKELGVIELPRRRRSANAVGLSGTDYQAWVELPIERSFVRHFSFVDSMRGVVTLEDGREVDVVLVGSVAEAEAADTSQVLRPEIRIVVEGDEFSGLDPAQLQETLRMRIRDGFWCSHWKDVELALQAAKDAKQKRKDALDWLDSDVQFPEGTTDAEKRETLLHALAKQILEREKTMRLPELSLESAFSKLKEFTSEKPKILLGEKTINFSSVELEKSMGGIRPDVVGTLVDFKDINHVKLAIEITVTSGMDSERVSKIRASGIPALEINLSKLGGRINQAGFTDILINDIAMKSWIFHPMISQNFSDTTDTSEEGLYATLFLREMKRYGLAEASNKFNTPEYYELMRNVKKLANVLSSYGYAYANDDYIVRPDTLINRLQSIKTNSSIGYRYKTSWQVINAIIQDKGWNRCFHPIYLLAIKTWMPTIVGINQDKVRYWRSDVIKSLKSGEKTYIRDKRYDKLLALLFPELAEGLAKPLPIPQEQVSQSQPSNRVALQGEVREKDSTKNTYVASQQGLGAGWAKFSDEEFAKFRRHQEVMRQRREAAAVWENAQNKPAN